MRKLIWLIPGVLALGVTYSVCAHGIPILRHDWSLPVTASAMPTAIQTLFSPWLLRGIGEPQPYPTTYLLGFLLWPLSFLPPSFFITALVAVIASSVAYAGFFFARTLGDNVFVALAGTLFALLNPWVYTEFVAGHIFMIAAYSVFLWILGVSLATKFDTPWTVLLVALAVMQIEFLVFSFPLLCAWLVVTKRWWSLAALGVAAMPIAFGVVAHYGEIATTPYTLTWQTIASIAPADAIVLRGYSTGYDQAFSSIGSALLLVSLCAAIGMFFAIRDRRGTAWFFALAVVATLLATGTKGPIGGLYAWTVVHMKASGLFRELYDVLAFLAIGIVFGFTIVLSRIPKWAFLGVLVCSTLAIPWITHPPFRWFVPMSAYTPVVFPSDSMNRVALYPALQPLSLGGIGSGYDPDEFVQSGRAIPINTFFVRFPESTALARGQEHDFADLRGLGVTEIVSRKNLVADRAMTRYVLVHGSPDAAIATQTVADSFPVLGLVRAKPDIVTVGNRMSGNGIFFGDVTKAFTPIRSSAQTSDAARGWIDAQLAFLRYPQIATRFGGVFTASSTIVLPVGSASAILAWTDGTLEDSSGHTVMHRARALHWISLSGHAGSLRCVGHCAVVATGRPPHAPAQGPVRVPRAVTFSYLMPWLIRATLPVHSHATLRWATTYEPSWKLVGIPNERHFRLDEVLNAWRLPAGPKQTVYLIEADSALAFVLECAAVLALFALMVAVRMRLHRA